MFSVLFYSMFGQEKKLPEKFRYKFMDAYIHIRSKLNPSCDSGTIDWGYEDMYIYMGKLKP